MLIRKIDYCLRPSELTPSERKFALKRRGGPGKQLRARELRNIPMDVRFSVLLIREGQGYRRSDLSSALGISTNALKRIEWGKTPFRAWPPSVIKWVKVALDSRRGVTEPAVVTKEYVEPRWTPPIPEPVDPAEIERQRARSVARAEAAAANAAAEARIEAQNIRQAQYRAERRAREARDAEDRANRLETERLARVAREEAKLNVLVQPHTFVGNTPAHKLAKHIGTLPMERALRLTGEVIGKECHYITKVPYRLVNKVLSVLAVAGVEYQHERNEAARIRKIIERQARSRGTTIAEMRARALARFNKRNW